MTRAGRRKTPERAPLSDEAEESGPLRRCLVTRARRDKTAMIRFVVGPGGEIVADLAERLPGRGMWLSARRDVLETAARRGGFARAAKMQVHVPPDLAALVEAGLVARIGERLGLARRAGQAVAGFDKAREWLGAGRAGLVVAARDGSAEERARFLAAVKPGERVVVVDPLSGAALGRVFARERVVHVAIAPGKLAAMIMADAARLAGIEGRDEDNGGDTA
jgi:predicted RNA-binding protein YlxR (DUF448 family)